LSIFVFLAEEPLDFLTGFLMAGFFTIGVTLSKILSQFLNKEPLEF
jgi:hypothetical protein